MAVCPRNGTLIIQGEINKLLIAMKRGTTWSSYSQQDEKIEALLKKFNTLKIELNNVADLKTLDSLVFLEPFLEVITSDQTSSSVTSLALVSVNTFLSYALIDPGGRNVAVSVCKIAEAVTRAKFSSSDLDSVVLMRILLVLRNLVISPIGNFLTNENVCEIMSSVFRVCFETRLSELLRKYAEHCLKEIVQCLFMQLALFAEDLDDPSNVKSISTTSDSNHNRQQRQKKLSQEVESTRLGGEVSSNFEGKTPNDMTHSDTIHLATSPCTPSGSMLDMQGTLHQSSNNLNEEPQKTDTSPLPETEQPIVDQSEHQTVDDNARPNQNDKTSEGDLNQRPLETETASVAGSQSPDVVPDQSASSESTGESAQEIGVSGADAEVSVEATQSSSPVSSDSRPNNLDLTRCDNTFSTEELKTEAGMVYKSGDIECPIETKIESMPADTGDSIPGMDYKSGDIECPMENKIESMPADNGDSIPDEPKNEETQVAELEQQGEYVNQQGVRFTASDPVEEGVNKGPYGIVSVRELLRCLVQLCDSHNKNNSESMIHIGLTLLTVAFEVGADSIANFPSLMTIVKDDLCKYLIQLLYTADRLTLFASNLQLLFLVFESMRAHLKFQFEMYLNRLLDIIASDNQKFRYEMKEIALESIVQLWRIPGLVTELYLNYDCDLYCPNLYEEQTKMLSKNCFPVHGIYNFHLLSLDALLTVIDSIENFCKQKTLNENSDSLGIRTNSLAISRNTSIPSHEDLMAIKRKKKLLTIGTEQFNMNSKKGIKFLQEQGLLSTPLDPIEVVHFLRENPHLDKKTIGEYLSNRSNLIVLDQFVKSFDFTNTRIDVALRMYLEAFRLPGESPLISLLMEQFADHWHKSNNCPFSNADAAFTLVYAIIMLNVDQHNHNVKRQNNPMTVEGFKKNLAGVNGGADFNATLLEDIYKTIKEEEIVMPAEHTGLVRDNYLWKVLLKRGQGKDGIYITAPGGSYNNYNHDLFSVIFTPSVAALSYVFDKTSDSAVCSKAMTGFRKCAMISAYYGMSNEFDSLTHTLCKFSTLLNVPETPENQIAMFGCNPKARISTKTVFDWAHRHGDILREGWKPILDCILQLYKWKLLPKILVEAEDFLELSGKISLLREETSISTKSDKGFFSTFYNSLSLIAFSADQPLQREPTSEEQKFIEQAHKTIMECPLEVLITESKFFRLDSLQEFVKALIAASYGTEGTVTLETTFNEDTTVFFLELLLKVVIQNRDRASPLWLGVRDHLYTLLMRGAATDQHFLVERTIVGVLRLAIRLMSREEMSPVVLESLRMLLLLKWSTLSRVSRHIAYGLYELLKTGAANIHTDTDWALVFTLLECVGAGRMPPRVVGSTPSTHETGAKSDGEVTSLVSAQEEDSGLGNERGYTSDSELVAKSSPASIKPYASGVKTSPELSPNTGSSWILVGREGDIQPVFTVKQGTGSIVNEFYLDKEQLFPHDPFALVKCCEALAFLVRDAAHVTPYNFEACVRCIRTFVEAIFETGERRKHGARTSRDKARRKVSRKRSSDQDRGAKSPTRASSPYDADESDPEELPNVYPRVYIQLLDLMHTLHIRTAQIYRWWADENPETEVSSLWNQGWCPLLQGIARLCCDTRKEVRMAAITYLQRALLVHDLQTLSGDEWECCFRVVLFPLLAKLLEDINEDDVVGMEETRMRAATLLSKVFLHHLTPLLVLPTFTQLWLHILDLMDRYMHADGSDLLGEAIPESLKNILLVMDSAKVFSTNDSNSYLWTITWDRIGRFLPHLKEELFKSHPAVEGFESPTASQGTPSQLPPDHAQQPAQGSNPTGPQPPTNTIEPSPNPGNFHSESTPQNPSSPSSYQSQFQPSFIPQSARPQVPSFQPLGFQPGAGYQRNVKAPEGPYYPQWSTSNQKSQSYLQATSLTSASLPTFLPMPVPPSSSYQQASSVYTLGMTSSASEMRPNIPSMSGPEFSSAGQGIASSQSTSSQAQDIITCSMQGILPPQGGMAGSHSAILQPPSYLIQQNASVAMPSESDLPLSKVTAPHPIINIVTQPQSYSNEPDPGAPPQLTEEVVSPSTAISVPARHAAPLFPQLISTPMGPPTPLAPTSDSFLSAFVPTPSHFSPFHTPLNPTNTPPYTIYSGAQPSMEDKENAKNFFYQNIPNPSSVDNIFMGGPAGIAQHIESAPRTSSGIFLNPDMSNIASLPSVVSHPDS